MDPYDLFGVEEAEQEGGVKGEGDGDGVRRS